MCDASTAWLIAAFIVGAMAGSVAGYVAAVLLRRDRDERLRLLIQKAAADCQDEATGRFLRDISS
jgi:hypothetical protein